MKDLLRQASRVHQFPLIGKLLRPRLKQFSHQDLDGFLYTQRLAYRCVQEIASMLRPGQSEKQVCHLMDQWQRDNGVKNFLHRPFAWFGDRSRFDGCPNYSYFLPSNRILKEGDVVILDTAPVVNGYPADIGYALQVGEKSESFLKSIDALKTYRKELPALFEGRVNSGEAIYNIVEQWLADGDYDNIHAKYPLGVLGHRLHKMIDGAVPGLLLPFSWQFYWSVLSRGAFSETLGNFHAGELDGLWAIEPHLGIRGPVRFGVKFEEMLWIKDGKAHWLEQDREGVFSV
jgi:Xaa-Pro aminopeptidase